MKRILLILLISLPAYFSVSIYFLDKGYFLSPIEYNGPVPVRYDSRGDGYFTAKRNGKKMHEGIDLLAEIGTPVFASRSGWVLEAQISRGFGNCVILRHADDITTIYAHLSKFFVTQGQYVRQGQLIGSVGKTGNANYQDIRPHLHFEVRKNDLPQDPMTYLE